MTPEAVRHRSRRLGWRTQPGNEGRTLVLVPDDVAVRPTVRPPVQAPIQAAVQAGEAAGLAELLREQLERERQRADKAEAEREAALAEVSAERARAERAEAAAAEQRSRADVATGEVDGMRLGLEHMQDVLAQARREAEETGVKAEQAARAAKDANERLARLNSRGWWARLRNRQ